jgi:hypothetical protein
MGKACLNFQFLDYCSDALLIVKIFFIELTDSSNVITICLETGSCSGIEK